MKRSSKRLQTSGGENRSATVAFPSDLGWMAAVIEGTRVVRLTFGHPSGAAALAALEVEGTEFRAAATHRIDAHPLVARLQAFAGGQRDDFRDVPLAIEHCTPFQRAVIAQCRRVPFGKTVTYGELARRSGFAGAARAVGRVMATNSFPLVVPCHRVVASNGLLGGYSAPQGLDMKRRLLAQEANGT